MGRGPLEQSYPAQESMESESDSDSDRDSDSEPGSSPPRAEGKAIHSQNLTSRVPHSVQMLGWKGIAKYARPHAQTPRFTPVLQFSRWRSRERGFV